MRIYPTCNRLFGAIALVLVIILAAGGCTGQSAKEGGATQGAGFQSASGNKLETGDIGDKAGEDIDKSSETTVQPQQTAQKGMQIQLLNETWWIVVLLIGLSLVREFFSWARTRIRQS